MKRTFIIVDFFGGYPTAVADEDGNPIAFTRQEAIIYSKDKMQSAFCQIVRIPEDVDTSNYTQHGEEDL